MKLYSDIHDLFRHPKPLWEREEFFVQLSFNMNEDINPAKANHHRMSPSKYKVAQEEC